MADNIYKIHEEDNVIDDHLLDIIGASFNFDHVKGMSEWLKNSVDAYRRAGTADKDQNIYFGNYTLNTPNFIEIANNAML